MRSTVQEYPYFFSLNGQPLEPEDYEGILQATAQRYTLDQGSNYLESRGWGHLQADNVYTKCDIDGFRSKHYSYTLDEATESTVGDWIPMNTDYFFTSDFDKNWNTRPELHLSNGTNAPQGYIREIRATYTLSDAEWYDDNLFIWGRGGTDGKGGYNISNPNHRYPWTEVTSGTGSIEPPKRYVPGIFHNNNMIVECRTYQFKYNTGFLDILMPTNDNIAFQFTVFGVPKTTSVKLSGEVPINTEMSIQPNPASNQIQIQYSLTVNSTVSLEIVDILGRNVIKPICENNTVGEYSEHIDISALSKGIYFCKVSLPFNKILIQPFIVEGDK
ncbi:MAG: T9SS type A sorting domain-containing protein [Ignavibacteriae bacterium]|nr:T9SS type A sorting domain-containing protein [Ignavibacteriota bacterium]